MYIYQYSDWPKFSWNAQIIEELLGEVRFKQGRLLGYMQHLGFELQSEAVLHTLVQEIVKSSEIEGETLNLDQVRSSLARRLGMDIPGLIPSDRDVDGIVDMMLDATQNFQQELDQERLFGWHSSLFPSGRSGMHPIVTGDWRRNSKDDPMQVVSGHLGRPKVHFQAPDSEEIGKEMSQFLDWFNLFNQMDPIIKAGIAHLWFVTIHPFEDGNGRIARAVTDLQLAKSDGCRERFYSMSSQIRLDRKEYYNILEKTQSGNLEITDWLFWFLSCLSEAIDASDLVLDSVFKKVKLWSMPETQTLNERQRFMLNKFLENFKGHLTSSKWAKMTKCSQDTAQRDIQDLISKNILVKSKSGGRSTHYLLL